MARSRPPRRSGPPPPKPKMPKIVHHATFKFGDETIRLYRLDNGDAIVDKDDYHKVFGGSTGKTPEEVATFIKLMNQYKAGEIDG